MEQRQGVSSDPSMLERGRDVPLADMGTRGGEGERSRLGCEVTHVEAGSYLQLFLFCKKTSGLPILLQ